MQQLWILLLSLMYYNLASMKCTMTMWQYIKHCMKILLVFDFRFLTKPLLVRGISKKTYRNHPLLFLHYNHDPIKSIKINIKFKMLQSFLIERAICQFDLEAFDDHKSVYVKKHTGQFVFILQTHLYLHIQKRTWFCEIISKQFLYFKKSNKMGAATNYPSHKAHSLRAWSQPKECHGDLVNAFIWAPHT